MRCVKLVIEYDGTDFVGWQSQLNGRAVQDEIIRALHQVLGEDVTLIGAGRTDSGVHARGQVAGFRTENVIAPGKLFNALNGTLPEDIRIHAVEEVPAAFHARFDARQRRYSYHISLKPTALDRRVSWFVKSPLDVQLMNAAAEQVIGKHNFGAFCKHEVEVENRVCTVVRSRWIREGDHLVYDGRGHTPIEKLGEILASHSRSEARGNAPARGLCLEEVLY